MNINCCQDTHIILCEKCNKFICINCSYILNLDDIETIDENIGICVSCVVCDPDWDK